MYFVYILSNWNDSVLYVGVTGNLPRRLYEHRNGLVDGFTKNTMFTNWCFTKKQTMFMLHCPGKSN